LSAGVINLLKEVRKNQAQNRLLLGHQYQNFDLVFCNNDGTPIDPSKLSKRFRYLADKHGFTNLRFHDLRPCTAIKIQNRTITFDTILIIWAPKWHL